MKGPRDWRLFTDTDDVSLWACSLACQHSAEASIDRVLDRLRELAATGDIKGCADVARALAINKMRQSGRTHWWRGPYIFGK